MDVKTEEAERKPRAFNLFSKKQLSTQTENK
jgi:hypothetical protein